jgi:hypothetical protein
MPINLDSADPNWFRSVWQGIVQEVFGGMQFDPEWIDRTTVMRSLVSTPGLLKRFNRINRKKSYARQVKAVQIHSFGLSRFDRML